MTLYSTPNFGSLRFSYLCMSIIYTVLRTPEYIVLESRVPVEPADTPRYGTTP